MPDLMAETLVPLCDVAARYPATGGKPRHVGVVRRWVRKGVAGVRLEAAQVAGRWYTSEQALGRFHDGVARARRKRGPVGVAARFVRPRPEGRRERESERAADYHRRRAKGFTVERL